MRRAVRSGGWLLFLLYRTNVSEAFGSRSQYNRQHPQLLQRGRGRDSGTWRPPTQPRTRQYSPRVGAMMVVVAAASPTELVSSQVTPMRRSTSTTRRSQAAAAETAAAWNPSSNKNKNDGTWDEDDALAVLIENWELEHDYLAANQYHPSRQQPSQVENDNSCSYPTKPALRLVHTVAKLMSKGHSEEMENEFIQEGIVALLQAMHHYPRLVAAAAEEEAPTPTTTMTGSPPSTRTTTNLVIPVSFEEYAARHILLEMTQQAPSDVVAAAATAVAATTTTTTTSKRSPSRKMTNIMKKKRMIVQERSWKSQGNSGNHPDRTVRNTVVSDDNDWYDKRHAMMMENINLEWEDDEDDDDDELWLHPHSYHPLRTTSATTSQTAPTTVRDSILTVVDRDELTPEDEALEAMIRLDVQTACREILNDVEFQVIRMHFGLEGEQRALSWREMAKRLKTTKQFVRSISEQAMAKLRRPGASRAIEPYREG